MQNIFWRKILAQIFLFFKGIVEHQTIGARIMLIDGSKKILLIKEGISKNWQFPGGGIDPGESFYQGVKRETFEETGYKIIGEIELHGVFHNIEASNRDHLAFFIGRDFVKEKEFSKNREIIDLGWFDIDNLPPDIAPSAKRRIGEIFFNHKISEIW